MVFLVAFLHYEVRKAMFLGGLATDRALDQLEGW